MRYIFFALAFILTCGFGGCGGTREATATVVTKQFTKERTVTKVVRQEVLESGKIVELTTTTVTNKTVNQDTGQTTDESSTVETTSPKIVGDFGAMLGKGLAAAAGVAGGPVVGAAAAAGVDWVTNLITGGAAAATVGGTGYVAVKRQRNATEQAKRDAEKNARQRDELIDGVESAMEHIDDPVLRKKVKKTLFDNQSDDTIEVVDRRTA